MRVPHRVPQFSPHRGPEADWLMLDNEGLTVCALTTHFSLPHSPTLRWHFTEHQVPIARHHGMSTTSRGHSPDRKPGVNFDTEKSVAGGALFLGCPGCATPTETSQNFTNMGPLHPHCTLFAPPLHPLMRGGMSANVSVRPHIPVSIPLLIFAHVVSSRACAFR